MIFFSSLFQVKITYNYFLVESYVYYNNNNKND